MAVLGCAHAAAKPPASAASSSSAPASSRASSASGGGSAAPLAPDRSEEITAAELASIPDPVPAAAEAHGAADSATAATTAAAPGAPTTATTAPTTAPGEPQSPTPQNVAGMGAGTTGAAKIDPGARGSASGGVLWRVQIFASPDLSQAGDVAREASAKLGEPAVVEYEGSLYKVRLGAFGSEAEAQSLRERAIAAGYPGAFRMRASRPATNDAR
jgi:hypothetical protein